MKVILLCGLALVACFSLSTSSNNRLEVRLLSDKSGKYVGVTRHGRMVHARSRNTALAARFYATYPRFGHIRLESVRYPGKFLMIREGRLEAATPKPGEEEDWEIVYGYNPSSFALKATGSENCYIAFYANGTSISPCGISLTEGGVWLRYYYIHD